jgi:hypothetical protein
MQNFICSLDIIDHMRDLNIVVGLIFYLVTIIIIIILFLLSRVEAG